MSILNKYKQWPLRIVVNRSNIMDVVVSDDTTTNYDIVDTKNGKLLEDNLIAYIDASIPNKNNEDTYIESLEGYFYKKWGDEDIELKDDILTAYDNGFLDIYDYHICEEDNSCEHFLIEKEDVYLTFYPIIKSEDELTLTNNSILFNGGFLQGFYKLYGFDYQTLPQYIENDEWNLEFLIKPNGGQLDDEAIFFYMGTRAENKFANFYNSKETTGEEKTSNGVLLDKDNYFEIETHNKYLPDVISGYTREYETEIGNNAYLIFSQNPKDYTVETIEEFYKSDKYIEPKYDVKNDLYYNAFSLFLTRDGEIGYRYLVNNCKENFIVEKTNSVEKTNKPVVEPNKWSTINVRFVVSSVNGICDLQMEQHTMKILIYVNGYLRFISQELPEFNFRELNDIYQKQEMVPYNISLGGGTLGLSESKLVFGDKIYELKDTEYISKYFNKRFYGELKTFKFYNGPLNINEIRNNYYYNYHNK